jgi:hypothetical protein
MKRVLLAGLLVVLLALALPGSALAAGLQEGKVVFGDNYVLRGGDTLSGDLTLLGGNAELEPGSQVTGHILMFGGNLTINGEVDGDVTTLGGNLNLGSSALVHGVVQSYGGNIERAPGARTEGGIEERRNFEMPFRYWTSPRTTLSSLIQSWIWFLFRTIILAALAAVVVMIWPKQTARVAQTATGEPLISGAVGLVTVVLAPIVLLVLGITICLIPLSVIGAILLVIALAFGRIALGLEIGNRLGHAFKQEWQPPADAFVGTLALFFVVDGIGLIPCIGWLAPFVVSAVGLGGVVLTRFGTRLYMAASHHVPPPMPPAPPTPPSPIAPLVPPEPPKD